MKKILAEVTFGLGLFAVLGTDSLFAADTYLVVNLLAKDANAAFSMREDVPEGGWTVADRTTNLVLRLCEPETNGWVRATPEDGELWAGTDGASVFVRRLARVLE